ncbi:MAG: recombinase RecT, partial [Flammeovirgaceae bacterium]
MNDQKNAVATGQLAIKGFFSKPAVMSKFEEMLGKRAPQYVTSILSVVNNNKLLQNATPESVYQSACIAATLDLPINNSLGFAWIVPYGGDAQFQIGWKGIVQLALRSGQYSRMNVVPVYSNQFKSFNALTEDLIADFSVDPIGSPVGYVAFFRLINGFEKTSYWSIGKVTKHADRFSKTFKSSNSVWKSDFDAMAMKTVLKNTISKWGIMSVEMQNAFKVDQAVVVDAEKMEVKYPDGTTEDVDHEDLK